MKRILKTSTFSLILCVGLMACTSDQADEGANAGQTSHQTEGASSTGSSALTIAPVAPIVPELADFPTGAYLSWSLLPAGQTVDRTIVINMASAQPVAGFQFRLSGGVPLMGNGGRASEVGFNVVSAEETRIVLGHFDPTTTIPVAPGDGVLTQITFRPDPGATEVCLEGPVVSDLEGNAIHPVLGGCVPLE